jgi:hypothetical protein
VYYWKTGQLASEIKNTGLEEATKKNYYLATTIVTLASIFVISVSSQKNLIFATLEFTAIILVSIIGIKITFTTNKGNSGIDYVGRMVALSFPLLIKLILFGIIFGLTIGFYAGFSKNTALSNFLPWASSLVAVVIQIWYFWRLNIHLRHINA